MVQSVNRYRAPEAVAQQILLSQLIAKQQALVGGESRVERPSDDPKAWLEVATISRFQTDEAAWTNNLGRAETRASQAEASLNTIVSGLIRARELLLQGNSGTISPNDPESLALEVDGLASDFRDALNQRDNYGGPLFGSGPPIRVPISDGRTTVASPNMDTVQEGIPIGGGATATLDGIMTATAESIRNGTRADRDVQLDALDGALNRITQLLTQQGVVRSTLESTRDQLEQSKLSLAARRSELSDANVTEALTRLQSLMTNLQATQAVYGQISQQNLFDYLR
ncbi:flagellin [Blastomonas sp.]|uniref:flagellin n=1 Tax=Blastomonas sp. TaxID=1909299 RepID=UPI002614B1DC|nr:flagellin [Blastomonas sp.]MDM7957720.1 flagellin [Blastomonas sp.]